MLILPLGGQLGIIRWRTGLLSLLFRSGTGPLAILSVNQGDCAINPAGFKRRAIGTSLAARRNPGLLSFDRTAPG